ncbi:phosphopantetheine-binding protein [Scandinavium sp. V105_16]|uniref:Phosphopantetheine-binding protein n=1 Tax=Scandinavium lactucae TaxID=3095028 RepID=A0AAJ2VWM4_9ENTR|nr:MULTISPECIES: phosphopantetheine-binding protein [unclassified Scandinavium]MDX6019548.1 phosphopantetheine-binding protein [Scandinavium sp. V105_16]MDX6031013.1 phosphopantetheine-binding protein [Scandinavium sp. V105_12]MDX6039878.1 phosphopantetheine-binding protein [Scandinavium sp. V105_6]MDX6051881.1 phosphopantetheine-binding protein [Scandinavium sp. V105_1]
MKIEQDVVGTVNNIIAQALCCDIEQVTKDKDMYYDLLADSLTMLDIFIALEQTYSIAYTEDDITKVERVEDLYRFVEVHI